MTDHRRTLRAKPPAGKLDRVVQTTVDIETYSQLYVLAKTKEISLRQLIRETLENLVGTR
jgi:hypothetical protein